MSTHQGRRVCGQGWGERLAEPRILNEHVTHAGHVANLEDWHALGHERALMIDGPQWNAGNAERNQPRRGIVDDGVDITANLVDLAVNEPFPIRRRASCVRGIAVEVVFEDIRRGYKFWRDRSRQKESVSCALPADADVTVAVQYPLVGENVIGCDQIFDDRGIHSRC